MLRQDRAEHYHSFFYAADVCVYHLVTYLGTIYYTLKHIEWRAVKITEKHRFKTHSTKTNSLWRWFRMKFLSNASVTVHSNCDGLWPHKRTAYLHISHSHGGKNRFRNLPGKTTFAWTENLLSMRKFQTVVVVVVVAKAREWSRWLLPIREKWYA